MAALEKNTAIRLPNEMLERADRLIDHVARDEALLSAGGRVTRSTVIRLAALRGLAELEARYSLTRKKRK